MRKIMILLFGFMCFANAIGLNNINLENSFDEVEGKKHNVFVLDSLKSRL